GSQEWQCEDECGCRQLDSVLKILLHESPPGASVLRGRVSQSLFLQVGFQEMRECVGVWNHLCAEPRHVRERAVVVQALTPYTSLADDVDDHSRGCVDDQGIALERRSELGHGVRRAFSVAAMAGATAQSEQVANVLVFADDRRVWINRLVGQKGRASCPKARNHRYCKQRQLDLHLCPPLGNACTAL